MKALKVSDQTHVEITKIVGLLTAESGIVKTYEDAVKALLHQSVIMPPEILKEIEEFIEKNKQFGYSTKEEFLRDAVRWLIDQLSRTHITTLLEPDLKEDGANAMAISPSSSSGGGE